MSQNGGEARAAPAGRAAWLAAALAANRGNAWLFVPVALGLGIWTWFAAPAAALRLAALLAALGVALAGLALRGPARPLLVAAGLLLAGGILAAEWRAASVAPPRLYHRLSPWPIEGVIVARAPRDGGAATRLVIARPASGADPPHRVRISIPQDLPPQFRPGAAVRVPAMLGPLPGPVLPGLHDPARAAWFDGLAATGRATGPPELLRPATATRPGAAIDGLRQDLSGHLLARFPGDAGGLAVALVVGEQGAIRPPLIAAMRTAGLAHLLTVSGFHIGIAVAGVFLVLRRLVGLWPWLALRLSGRAIAAPLAAAAGSFYALLAGAEVPAVRAAIMAWVVMLAVAAGRNPLSLRLLALAATLILLARPEYLLSASFQLSFAAVTGLVLLANSRFGQDWLRSRSADGGIRRLGRYALALLASGLVAEIILSPIALAHFGRAGLYGVAANLVAIPLTSFFIMPLFGLYALLAPIGLGAVAAVPLGWALNGLAAIGVAVSSWPGASVTVPAVAGPVFALGVMGALLLALLSGRLRWAGAPLLAAALLLAMFGPRPDLFVAADGRQVALAADDGLYALRPHRRGFQWRAWEQAAGRTQAGRIADLPSAACSALACRLERHGLQLLLVLGEAAPAGRFDAACADADIVIAPVPLRPGCRPRLALLDAPALRGLGTIAIDTKRRRLLAAADIAGDHAWSAAALPGTRVDLLGRQRWTGVIAE